MKKLMLISSILILVLCTACSSSVVDSIGKDVEDTIAHSQSANDKYVQMVRNGYPSSHPSVSYEQAFTTFFGSPQWKHFKAEDGREVVEFTGDCTYQDAPVKARIQFVVNEQQGTFETAYLAFNEVPQNKLILAALIEKAFSSVQSPQSAAGNNGQPISYSEAKGLFQAWLDAHTFPVVVEVGGSDQKLHKVSGSDREYYMFQIRGMTRLHDVLVEPNTREMFIYDTGKPEPIEEWYQKFVVPQNKKK